MLVLTRQKGQSIVINETIVVTITELRGGRVKVGITAPTDIVVRRAELAPREGKAA